MKKAIVIPLALLIAMFAGLFLVNNYVYNQKQSEGIDTSDWQSQTVEEYGLTFSYPENINTNYIDPVDWPPQVQIIDESYSCTEAGSPFERAGATEEKIINDKNYCVTTVAEGAAGSIYRQYAYATAYNDQTIIFTFSFRFPQCGNYDEQQRNECEEEYNSFNLDTLMSSVIKSI